MAGSNQSEESTTQDHVSITVEFTTIQVTNDATEVSGGSFREASVTSPGSNQEEEMSQKTIHDPALSNQTSQRAISSATEQRGDTASTQKIRLTRASVEVGVPDFLFVDEFQKQL